MISIITFYKNKFSNSEIAKDISLELIELVPLSFNKKDMVETPLIKRKINKNNENHNQSNNTNKNILYATPTLQENWRTLIEVADSMAQNIVIDIFAKLDQVKLQHSLINYIINTRNIHSNLLSEIIAITDKINENLYHISAQLYNNTIEITQHKIEDILCNLISQSIKSIAIEKKINKNELSPEELVKVNSCTKYRQYTNLANTDSVNNQCLKDSSRNFNIDITLSKDGKQEWKSNPQENKIFQECYNKHIQYKKNAMQDWVCFCRNKVHEFVMLCYTDKLEQQQEQQENSFSLETTNAILLEATQAGSVTTSRVMKNHLKQIFNLPTNYNVNLTDFNYKLEVDYRNNNMQINNQLICNCIEIVSGLGIVVAKSPPSIITGNLYYNYNLPENSFYDNFAIECI